MKKQKLKIQTIKITSFIPSVTNAEQLTIKGANLLGNEEKIDEAKMAAVTFIPVTQTYPHGSQRIDSCGAWCNEPRYSFAIGGGNCPKQALAILAVE